MTNANRWPSILWVVRHGESAGNVAFEQAYAAGLEMLDIEDRDMDVPLSALGEQQATALGHWFARMPASERPEVVLASPYRRAQDTARLILEAGGGAEPGLGPCFDERLREREFGVLDRLTKAGIDARHPGEALHRQRLGKFYYRPPGGESWCDVILRLRSLLDTLSLHHSQQRVLIVAHQVVVLCLRYLLENMDEKAILAIDAEADVANCSITEYHCGPGGDGQPALVRYNFVSPVADKAPVTSAPDLKVASR